MVGEDSREIKLKKRNSEITDYWECDENKFTKYNEQNKNNEPSYIRATKIYYIIIKNNTINLFLFVKIFTNTIYT